MADNNDNGDETIAPTHVDGEEEDAVVDGSEAVAAANTEEEPAGTAAVPAHTDGNQDDNIDADVVVSDSLFDAGDDNVVGGDAAIPADDEGAGGDAVGELPEGTAEVTRRDPHRPSIADIEAPHHIDESVEGPPIIEKRFQSTEDLEEPDAAEDAAPEAVVSDEVGPPLVEPPAPPPAEEPVVGDGEGEGEEEGSGSTIPDDFFYDTPEVVEQAEDQLSPDTSLLFHSFGYECRKRSNLHFLEDDVIMFAAGNVVQIVDLATMKQDYLRSTSGRGIGALAVHPTREFFAVAEKGSQPNINIYHYPSLRLYRVLRSGTDRAYAAVSFNQSGRMLASVGASPDFMLTVWDWRAERITLRSKAFSQDVFRVSFSPENDGQLTTSGTGHIRFWKMAQTFTGLKLQGYIGKFGRTELSDISGYVELPDGKVLSGTEWGNLLLWDAGLIKCEISKKGGKRCHKGMIEECYMEEGELVTAGADGYVKVWDFETIDNADITEDSNVFELDPMSEVKVGSNVRIRSLVKSPNKETPSIWYVQDGSGSIWKIDLSLDAKARPPERLLSFHAGPVLALDVSPVSHICASAGDDGAVRIYDYVMKTSPFSARFRTAATCLVWAPKQLDSTGSTLVVGFADGIVRLLRRTTESLQLSQALKPHNGRVTTLAYDQLGKRFASASEDGTIFFFAVTNNKFEPLGFVRTPSPVMSLCFSPPPTPGDFILACCKDGDVIEIASPVPGAADTSQTYNLEGLAKRSFRFKGLKVLRKKERVEVKTPDGAPDGHKEGHAEPDAHKEADAADGAAEGDAKEGEEAAKKEDEFEEVSVDGKALCGFYTSKTRFYLSFDAPGAGKLYECSFDDDTVATEVLDLHTDSPCTAVRISSASKYLLAGLRDGGVRIIPLLDTSSYWKDNVHDNDYGQVTAVCSSFDDSFLFSAGTDGNVFVHRIMTEAVQHPYDGDLLPASAGVIDDVDEAAAHSIEESRQKAEQDRKAKVSDDKKEGMRRMVDDLRREFLRVLDRNNALPKHMQIPRDGFDMDPERRQQMLQEREDRLALTKKELAYEAERHRLALEKLQARFKDVVECERIVVRSFSHGHEVATFRTPKLSQHMRALLDDAHGSSDKAGDNIRRRDLGDIAGGAKGSIGGPSVGLTGAGETARGGHHGRHASTLSKAEQRKLQRQQRAREWAEHMGRKPDGAHDNPADLALIREAEDNMGDYKLKAAKGYVVPESQRVNAETKRRQLILLREAISEMRGGFNSKLIRLRDEKRSLIAQLAANIGRLREIHAALNLDDSVPDVPRMDPDECPEERAKYDRESLLKWKVERDAKARAAKQHDFGGFGGFGGGGGGGGGGAGGNTGDQQQSGQAAQQQSGQNASQPQGGDYGGSVHASGADGLEDLSDLERQEREVRRIRLTHERKVLLASMKTATGAFDDRVGALRRERVAVEGQVKAAELRQLLLFEELVLLKEFEKRETVLLTKLGAKQNEKSDMGLKVEECRQKLSGKQAEVQVLQAQERAVHTEFIESLGENNKYTDLLSRMFKRKIKRVKKKAQKAEVEGGSDAESDAESDDSDLDDDDLDLDDVSDDLDVEDSCPPGCDKALYDRMLELRERRLDVEEFLQEERKSMDALKKEFEALEKKDKIIDIGLKGVETDIQAFQSEKQKKLNELDVEVTLRLHQIQNLVKGRLPKDLASSLVFTGAGILRLARRIRELQNEKSLQRRQYKELRQLHVKLQKDGKAKEVEIEELEGKARDIQMLKFGRLIDIERLETMSVNKAADDMKDVISSQEVQWIKEEEAREGEISAAKEDLMRTTKENTKLLEHLADLTEERHRLEESLNATEKALGGEYAGPSASDVKERERLKQLVEMQLREIDVLRNEIAILSRKDGQLFPTLRQTTHAPPIDQ